MFLQLQHALESPGGLVKPHPKSFWISRLKICISYISLVMMLLQLLERRFINLYFPGSISALLLSVRVKIMTVFQLSSLEISPFCYPSAAKQMDCILYMCCILRRICMYMDTKNCLLLHPNVQWWPFLLGPAYPGLAYMSEKSHILLCFRKKRLWQAPPLHSRLYSQQANALDITHRLPHDALR